MTAITIRNLDEGFKARLRLLAARNGRSMEEEARQLLRKSLDAAEVPPIKLAALAMTLFGPENGVDLELPDRGAGRELPVFPE